MEDSSFPAESLASSPAASASNVVQDASEDACSICLEPFSVEDPATLLILKDPVSQELLAAVEIERSSRSRRRSSNASTYPRIPIEDFEFHHVQSYADDSDFDDHIMQHLAVSSMGRALHSSRRERHRSSGLGRSQFLVFATPTNGSDEQQMHMTMPIERQDSGHLVSPENDSPTAVMFPSTEEEEQPPASVPLSHSSAGSDVTENSHCPFRPRILASQTPPSSPRRSRPSELLSFSESLKSKLSAASSRYRESISKSTRGFKEKLLARNNSVKELSKEVQREVTAGIAGVARMMERLDPTSKRTGGFNSVSSGAQGTSEFSQNGNCLQENMTTSSPIINGGGAQGTSSDTPMYASGAALPSGLEGPFGVTHVQDSL